MALPNNQQVSLRDALETIPMFDGKNIPLSIFIESCLEAKSMLPDNAQVQTNLVKLIRSLISGEARRIIIGNNFNTVEQLTERLKQIYAPAKSVYQLQGELGAIYMWEHENVISYESRIAERILDAHRISNENRVDEPFKASLDKTTVDYFSRGLRPEIEIRIGTADTFQEIVNKAVEIERKLLSHRELRKSEQNTDYNSHPKNNKDFAKTTKINIAQDNIITCLVCGKKGHFAVNCFQLNKLIAPRRENSFYPGSRQNFSNQNQNRFNNPNPTFNRFQSQNFYKNHQQNHFQNQFRNTSQNQFRNIPQNQFRTPYQNERQNQQQNIFQNQQRNFSQEPRTNNTTNFANRNQSITCNYCKKLGHISTNCRKKMWDDNNRQQQTNSQTQNQGNSKIPLWGSIT
ncbi:GATA zinc finger domain-containing protein 14-like [Leptopilina heterotoma]|uniref:GATA zinc finger domain-containing protein 14-like n=1 Tax=Leptopilina heterotoma TaxID=63436 RepID=UPI001CA96509|nr:GATA zinc finger domain-containing protein 14-like [Leptopilina heterotoma]